VLRNSRTTLHLRHRAEAVGPHGDSISQWWMQASALHGGDGCNVPSLPVVSRSVSLMRVPKLSAAERVSPQQWSMSPI